MPAYAVADHGHLLFQFLSSVFTEIGDARVDRLEHNVGAEGLRHGDQRNGGRVSARTEGRCGYAVANVAESRRQLAVADSFGRHAASTIAANAPCRPVI